MSNPKSLHSPKSKKKSVSFGAVTEYPLTKSTPKKKKKSTRLAIKNPDPPLFLFCPNAPDSIYPAFIYDSSTPSSTMIPTALVSLPLSVPVPSDCGSTSTATEVASDSTALSSFGITTIPSSPHNSGMLVTAVPHLESTEAFFTEDGALKIVDSTTVETQAENITGENTAAATVSKGVTKNIGVNTRGKPKGKRASKKKNNAAAPGFMFSRPQGMLTLEQLRANAIATSSDNNTSSTNEVACVTNNAPRQEPKSSPNCCPSTCTFCFLGYSSENHLCKNTVHNRREGAFRCKHCKRTFCREDLLSRHQMRYHRIEKPETLKLFGAGVVKKRAICKDDRHTLVLERGLLRADATNVPFDPQLKAAETVQPFGDAINVGEPVPVDDQNGVNLQFDVDDIFNDMLNAMSGTTTPSNGLSFNPAEPVGTRAISGCRILTDCNVEPHVASNVEHRDITPSYAKEPPQPDLQVQPNMLDLSVVQQATDTSSLLMPTLDEFLSECSILYDTAITTSIGTSMTTEPNPLSFNNGNTGNSGDHNNVIVSQHNNESPSFEIGATLSSFSTKCTTTATSHNDDVTSFQTLSSDELKTLKSLSCSYTDEHVLKEGSTEVRPEHSAFHVDCTLANDINSSSQEEPFDDLLKMDIDNFQTIIENDVMYELPLPDEFVHEGNANIAEQNLPLMNFPVSSGGCTFFDNEPVNMQPQCGQELFVTGNQFVSELTDLDIDGFNWN